MVQVFTFEIWVSGLRGLRFATEQGPHEEYAEDVSNLQLGLPKVCSLGIIGFVIQGL